MENKGLGFYGKDGIEFQEEGAHIIENIERILTTVPGERAGNLMFGSNVRKYIFQPESRISDLISEVTRSVEYWEPRVKVKECRLVKKDFDTIELDLNVVIVNNGKDLNIKVDL